MTKNHAATKVHMSAAKCRELAGNYKAGAKEAGISQKRAALFTNIARSFSGLASQLEMLTIDSNEESR